MKNALEKLNELLPSAITQPLDFLDNHKREFIEVFGKTFKNFILSDLNLYTSLKIKEAKDIPNIDKFELANKIAFIVALVMAFESTANDSQLEKTVPDKLDWLNDLCFEFPALTRIIHMNYSVWELDENNHYFYDCLPELVAFGQTYLVEKNKHD